MKRVFSFLIIIFIFIIMTKFFTSDYNIKYKINNYNVNINYKNNRYYIEIKDKYIFNFDLYNNRRIKRKIISSIETYKSKELYCIYPIINGLNTYPLCYENNQQIDYHLIKEKMNFKNFKNIKKDEKTIYESNNNIKVFNNLNNKSYVAIWKYNGFYLLNNEKVKILDLFKNDNYENDLCIQFNNYLLLPNYNEEHIFKNFILVNIKNGNKKTIKTKFEIDYDSYIAGINKNNVYLFDNKNNNLYEINILRKKVKLIGNEEIGFVKIDKNKIVRVSLNDYKINKITYFKKEDNFYTYEKQDGIFKNFNENKNVTLFIGNFKNVTFIKKYKNKLYFIEKDNFYEYNPNEGVKKIFNYFELNFNKELIYVYNE